MKLKTLQTLWKLDYLMFFWNYLDINYVFQSICNMWALCGFNTMPCVIFRWSPDLVFVVFVTMKSYPSQCPFILDDAFFPTAHGGKRFLDCVWMRPLSIGPKDHMQERSYLTRSLLPMGEEKNLKGMGETVVHRAKSLHTKEENIMPVVNGWIPWPVYVVVW